MILIDILSPSGHKLFNDSVESFYATKIQSYEHQGRGRGILMFYNHARSIIKSDTILLVSFDTITLFLCLPILFIKRNRISAIVHNNLESAAKNKLHLYLLRIISLTVDLIFIAEYLKSRAFNLKISGRCIDFIFLELQRNYLKNGSDFTLYIFEPKENAAFVHGRTDLSTIERFNSNWVKYDVILMNNDNLNINSKKWICKRFTDLSTVFSISIDCYFLNEINYRQYSILFEIFKYPHISIKVKDHLLFLYIKMIVDKIATNQQVELIR